MNGGTNLFFALWPDDATRQALCEIQAHIRGRLTPYQNLHLTLAFLGVKPRATFPMLQSLMANLDNMPIRLEINRVGYFKKNRIAWAGTHAIPPALGQMRHQITELLEKHQFLSEYKTFKPHITLARHAEPLPDLSFEPFVWLADQIVLAQSPMPNESRNYKILASKQLKTGS